MDFSRRVALGISLLALIAGCNRGGLVSAPVQNDTCTNSTPAPTPTAFASGATATSIPAIAIRQGHQHVGSSNLQVSANAAYSAPTAAQMLAAMDADPSVIQSSQLTVTDPRQAAIFPVLGTIQPTAGNSFAFLSTGVAGAGTSQSVDPSVADTQPGTEFNPSASCGGSGTALHYDCASLTVTFTVPANMHSVSFDFNFLSTEYPEFVNQGFNDEFIVSESSPSYNYANVVYDNSHNPVDIDSVLFSEPCTSLTGSAFDLTDTTGLYQTLYGTNCDAGGTGMLTTQAPVAPGETVTLTFQIFDSGDSQLDSAVMIDHLVVSPNQVSNPNTGGQQVTVDCIYPNHGPMAGGNEIRIHGTNFVNVTQVTFGGQAATSFNVASSTLIKATVPATSYPGPVDVEVTAQPSGTLMVGKLTGGYTYDDGSTGTGP